VIIPLHKLAFLSEYGMNDQRLKGFNYSFYRDFFGPAAPGIYEDFTTLVDSGLIEDSPFKITSRGNEVLEGFKEAFGRPVNKKILDLIDETVRSNPINTGKIKSKVYAMTIELPDGQSYKVAEIPFHPHRKILSIERLNANKASGRFELTDEELETLDVLLDSDQCGSLSRAETDVRNGRIRRVVH